MIVFRYLLEELYSIVLAMTMVLLMILMANQLVHFTKMAADGVIPLMTVVRVILLQIPSFIAYLLPLVFYLSVLLGLSRLYADSEMVVLHACGFSRFRLSAIVMSFAFVMALMLSYMMFALDAKLHRAYLEVIQSSGVKASVNKVIPKRFMRLPGGRGVVYAKAVDKDHHLHQVFFAFKQKDQWNVIVAKEAFASEKDHIQYLVFKEGHRYTGFPGQWDFQSLKFDAYLLNASLKKNDINMDPTPADIRKQEADWHWRMAMPISLLVLSLYAISLGRVNRRKSRFANIFPAVLIYLIYMNTLYCGRGWLREAKLSMSLGLWWVHGAMLVMWLVYFGLIKRRRV